MSAYEDYLKRKKEQQSGTANAYNDYRQRHGIEGVDVAARYETFVKNHNTYVDNYNYRNSANNTGYRSDTSEWLSRITTQNNNFRTEADYIKSLLSDYDEETKRNVTRSLDDMLAVQENIIGYSTKDDEYWSQWRDKADYDAYTKAYGEYEEKMSRLKDLSGKIGTTYDTAGGSTGGGRSFGPASEANAINDEYAALYKELSGDFVGKRWAEERARADAAYDVLSQYNKAYASDSQYADVNYLSSWKDTKNGIASGLMYGGTQEKGTVHLTDDERATYNYIYAKEGKDAANSYLQTIDERSRTREFQNEIAEKIGNGSLLDKIAGSAATVLSKPLESYAYARQAIDFIFKGKVDPNAEYNDIVNFNSKVRDTVAEGWGPVGSFFYRTGMSMADFLFNAFLTAPVGGLDSAAAQKVAKHLALTLMGTEAAAETVISAKERGLSDARAFARGTIAGAAEYASEIFSLEALFNANLLGASKIKYMLTNAFTEGSEEVASDIINLFADIAISKDRSEWQQAVDAYKVQGMNDSQAYWHAVLDTAEDMGLSFAGGALSGAAMGGGAIAVDYASNRKTGKAVAKEANGVEYAIDIGLDSPKESDAYKAAVALQQKQEAGKKISKAEIGELAKLGEQQVIKTVAEALQKVDKNAQEEAEKKAVQDNAPIGEAVKGAGFEGRTAEIFAEAYDPDAGMTTGDYVRGMREAYLMGQTGETQTAPDGYAAELSSVQFNTAFRAGEIAAKDVKFVRGKVRVVDNTDLNNLSDEQKTQMSAVKVLAKLFPKLKFNVFSSTKGKNGQQVGANGWIEADGNIYIDLNSGWDGRGTILFTVSHEVTHLMERLAPEEYKAMKDFLLSTYAEAGKTEQQLIAAKRAALGKTAAGWSDAKVLAEVIADSCQSMLADPDVWNKITALGKESRNWIQRFVDFFKEFVEKLRRMISDGFFEPDTAEGKMLKEMKDAAEQARDLWVKGFNAATKSKTRSASVNKNVDTITKSGDVITKSGDAITKSTKNTHKIEKNSQTDEEFFAAAIERGKALNGSGTQHSTREKGEYADYDKPRTIDDVRALHSIGQKDVKKFTHNDLIKARKWAYRDYRDLEKYEPGSGVKSPFFRAQMGEWRNHDKTHVIVVTESSDTRGEHKNIDTGWVINRSSKVSGEKHESAASISGMEFLKYIDGIIENSVLLGTSASNKQNENSLFFHDFYAVVDTNGNRNFLKLIVEEQQIPIKGDYYRAYKLVDIKKFRPSEGVSPKLNSSLIAGTKINIAQLFEIVKSFDKKYVVGKEISPKLLDKKTGRPKVLYHQTGAAFDTFNTDNPKAGAFDSETPNGIFLKDNDHDIGIGGNIQMPLYGSMENPLEFANRDEARAWYIKNVPGYAEVQKRIDAMNERYEAEYDPLETAWDEYYYDHYDEYVANDSAVLKKLDAYQAEMDSILAEWKAEERKLHKEARDLLNDYFLTGKSEYDGIILDFDGRRLGEDVKSYIFFNKNQIKSATDNIGTFDRENDSTLYSTRVKPEVEAEYLELAKDPEKNAAKLSQMVAEAAKAAGYTELMYHGSKSGGEFTTFRDWAYFTRNKEYAQRYAKRENAKSLVTAYVRMENTFDTRKPKDARLFNSIRQELGMSPIQESGFPDWTDGYDLAEYIDDNDLDYDSIVLDEGGDLVDGKPVSRGPSYVVRKSAQIKSADPVVYDGNGNVIPLSERFDPEEDDIRRSTRTDSAVAMAYQALSEELVKQNENLVKTVEAVNETWKRIYDETGNIPTKTEINAAVRVIANKAKWYTSAVNTKNIFVKTKAFFNGLQSADIPSAVSAAQSLAEDIIPSTDAASYNRNVNNLVADILNVALDTMTMRRADRTVMVMKAKEQAQHLIDEYKTNQAALQRSAKARGDIVKLADKITKMINSPQKGKFVTEDLLPATLKLLNSINFDTGRSGKTNVERLAAIRSLYEKYNAENGAANEYSEYVDDMLKRLETDVGTTPLNRMTQAQLNEVKNALTAMLKKITDADKLFYKDRIESAKKINAEMMRETEEARRGKAYSDQFFGGKVTQKVDPRKADKAMLRSKTMFIALAGGNPEGGWAQEYEDLNRGQNDMTQYQMEASRLFRDVISKRTRKNVEALSKETIDTGLKDNAGKEIKVPKGFAIDLYLSMLNRDNARHTAMGGFAVPDFGQYYDNSADAYSTDRKFDGYGKDFVKDADAIRETAQQYDKAVANNDEAARAMYANELQRMRADLAMRIDERVDAFMELADKLYDSFSAWDKELIRRIQQYYNEFAPERLNEVTRTLYGFDKANVENYFPIWVDKNFLGANYDARNGDYRIVNMGSMQERVVSSKPIVLADVLDVLAKSINFDSRYVGLAVPLDNFSKAYGYSTGGKDNRSLKATVEARFGKQGTAYIDRLLKNLNGVTEKDGTAKLRGNLAKASLMLNLRVMLSQAASFPTAAAVVGYKPLIKALAVGGKNGWVFSKADRAAIEEISPLLWARLQGESTIELGDAAHTQNMFRNNSWKWATGWIQAMDAATVGRLFYAAKYYVQDTLGIKEGDAGYKAKLKETFERVVQETQPNYSTMQRPDILRRGGVLRLLTMFKTQLFQNYNIVREAAMVYNFRKKQAAKLGTDEARAKYKEAKAALARAISSQIISAITIAAIRFAVDMLMAGAAGYRDDDKRLTGESIAAGLADNVLNSMASSVIGGDVIYNAVKAVITGGNFYGLELGAVENVSEALSQIVKLAKDPDWGKAYKTAETLARAIGIPAGNVRKIAEAIYKPIADAATEKRGFLESHIDRTPGQWSNILYDSVVNGNELWEEKARAELTRHYMEDGTEPRTEEEAAKMVETALIGELREGDERFTEAKDAYEAQDYKKYNALIDELEADYPSFSNSEICRAATGNERQYTYSDVAYSIFFGEDNGSVERLKNDEKYAVNAKAALTRLYRDAYLAASKDEKNEIKKRLWESGLWKKYSEVKEYLKGWETRTAEGVT